MARATPDLTAGNYGYISPRLRGRADLDFYDQSLDYLQNYISVAQGELALRYGSIFVSATRNNNVARLMPFLYNTEQAYIIEATDQYFRFYRNNGLLTETAINITAITQAANAQITAASHGYSIGDPVIFAGVIGMHQINGVEAQVASVVDANNFTINLNTTGFDAYSSGGTVAEIFQLSTPYLEAELFEIEYTQDNNTMYIVHPNHQPRKLTRSTGATSFTLGTFDFIGNPFGSTKASGKTITGITQADPAVVTSASHGYSNGDTVLITGVVGMTEVNNKTFTVRNVATNTFELEDYDSTDNDAYSSGGTAEKFTDFEWPSLVALFEGRLIYAASDLYPTRLWFSKIREDESLDDFTTGDLDADAIIYKLKADQANRIRFLTGAENYLALGTSGSEFRISGGGDNNAITPTNISVKPTSFNGVSTVKPIRLDSYILYVQRNGRTVRSFEYNALQDGYVSPDRTLLADHIGISKFKQLAYTAGTPNIIWTVRNDGKMVGLTFDPGQQVVAWHPHKTNGQYLSIGTVPEPDDDDELWQVVERTIDGQTKRYVEYTPNVPDIPVIEDYFTGVDNKETDLSTFLSALWNVQKTLVYCDSALVFDGKDSATVNLTITGDLTTGEAVTVTASGAFFTSQMATDKRRIQSPNGGQIEITGYTSSTVVTGTVLYDVESASLAAGEWAYMARAVGGLTHLEGASVSVLADGGVIRDKTVTDGEISLDDDAGYVIVGLQYVGIGKTQDIEGGAQNGRSQTKPKSVTKLGVRVRATLGTQFGTDLYNMEDPPYRESGGVAGRPPELISGVIEPQIPDSWEDEKYIYWLHDTPTPSNLQYLMAHMESNDE